MKLSEMGYRLAGWIILFSAVFLWPFHASGETARVLHGVEYRVAGPALHVTVLSDPPVPEFSLLNYTDHMCNKISTLGYGATRCSRL